MKMIPIGTLEVWAQKQKRVDLFYGELKTLADRILFWEVSGLWKRFQKAHPDFAMLSTVDKILRLEQRYIHAPAEIRFKIGPEADPYIPPFVEEYEKPVSIPDFGTLPLKLQIAA